jgi:hypothetical protein
VSRAISDEGLHESFLDGVPESLVLDGTLGGQFASKVALYRSPHHAHSKNPGKCWGVAGSTSVVELKAAIRESLGEYFATADVAECIQSVRELEAPYFLHELVSKAIIISLDHGVQGMRKAHLLLQTACEEGFVTPSQVTQGLERVLDSLHDVVIDVPTAPQLVARFLFQAFEDGWATRDMLEERKGGPWGEAFSHGNKSRAKKAALAELAKMEAAR